jgi:uncharacterized protein (DUF1800 family)
MGELGFRVVRCEETGGAEMNRDASPENSNRTRGVCRPGAVLLAPLAFALIAGSAPALAQHPKVVGGATGPVTTRAFGDAVRFLEQATFGPTTALVGQVQDLGFDDWLAEQFAAAASSYPALPAMPASSSTGCPTGSTSTCVRDNYTMYPLQVAFFKNALGNDDQLRQRVALALHEILVASGVKITQPSQMAPYLNMLLNDAFGNYRQILWDLTLNPAMGHYLDMVNNDAPVPTSNVSPNENYAREVMQLFSVGVNLLNPDGSEQVDTQGNPIPTYTQDNIEDFAHVFTGWTYAPIPPAKSQKHNPANFLAPMILYRDATGKDTNHDKGPKILLDYPGAVSPTLPAGGDGEVELNAAIDNIFHHPNVGAFVGKQLIQHLVTSNPSPSYVSRVAHVFDDNGAGVRGDMKAVVHAILLDPEARGLLKTDPSYGHLREPVLFITNLLRALDAVSDGILAPQANAMGQNLFYSPTVFSYYPHEYAVSGTSIQGPEMGIQSSLAAINRANSVNTLAFSQLHSPAPDPGTVLDLSPLKSLAPDATALVRYLDRLLMHGSMSADALTTVTGAVAAIPATNPLLRAQTALYLVASSSQYQVAR